MLKFFVALAVVMIVSIISLGWRVGIVVAAAVPLTLAAVFVIMLVTGRVFDRITLGALILGLGLLVDDAIISIEIMVVKMEEGWDRVRAAGYAWSHTAAPMLAARLSLLLVSCQWVRSIERWRVCGKHLLGSGFCTAHLLGCRRNLYSLSWRADVARDQGPARRPRSIYATPGYEKLRRLIAWAVRRKVLVACIVVGIFIAAVAGMGLLKQQSFRNPIDLNFW
jgi:Cation/multidrug efflux pump